MQLPEEFIEYTAALMGKERWERYVASFEQSVPVSIRLNPWKAKTVISGNEGDTPLGNILADAVEVPWCRDGYYLQERPNFTLDPCLHAGAYYVQEASSMFLDEVIRQLQERGLIAKGNRNMALDLCAAPGGKSTLLRAALSHACGTAGINCGKDSWMLYSNEPDRRRANILMENMQKQGHPDVVVTNNFAADFQKSKMLFDLILCDVPCSGEGMFRKDEDTIKEWSLQNVMKCAALQRSIVEDIWPCLTEGGIMIYSTCTFNLHEDEENVRWICETLGGELLTIDTQEEWNITGSLLEGWNSPVYRFIPGVTKGEGIFMAVIRKTGSSALPHNAKDRGGKMLRVLSDGNPQPTVKGKNIIPAHAEALLINLDRDKYPQAELSLEDAQRYLHHEAITLPPDVPKGITVVTYKGLPLGFVKNIGNRANNLYPQEWKIRNLN